MLLGTRIPLRINRAQEIQLRKKFGWYRRYYNQTLVHIQELREKNQKICHSTLLPLLKKEPFWNVEIANPAVYFAMKNEADSFQKGRTPRFKTKYDHRQSLPLFLQKESSNLQIFSKSIFIKDIGIIKAKYIRNIQGKIKSARIIRDHLYHYYLCLSLEIRSLPKTRPKQRREIGLDAGIHSFLMSSNGKSVSLPNKLKIKWKKIKTLQAILANKIPGSKNHEKTRLRIAKLYEDMQNCKKDFFHKLAYCVSQNYSFVAIESLGIRNMMGHHSIARLLQQEAIGEFYRILAYKMAMNHKTLAKVPKYYPSSQICHHCQQRNPSLKLSHRKWVCPSCHKENERDINAALNILKKAKEIYNPKRKSQDEIR